MKEIKFLVNSMCGRLARFLRIFGYDTVYANDLKNYFRADPVPDDKLLEFALENDRIIITKDNSLYKKIRDKSVYLEGEGVYNYLNQLKIKLGLNYNFNMLKARCSVCNSELDRVENKDLIKDDIQAETYKYYDDFYQCKNPNCKKVYWKGTHIENIIKRLRKE